jgi:hypothetical protein
MKFAGNAGTDTDDHLAFGRAVQICDLRLCMTDFRADYLGVLSECIAIDDGYDANPLRCLSRGVLVLDALMDASEEC